MPYQTFPNQPGDSDSQAKLLALHLPPDLTGKSFLDIGCNEGFFCLEAKRRGASKVVGLDSNQDAIQKAINRAKEEKLEIEFIWSDWNFLPYEKFDYILFASSLHYVQNPIEFFDSLFNHLTDSGILILECGVVNSEIYSPSVYWTPRINGSCFHARLDNLLHNWLRKFCVRDIGASVMQGGDPVQREVFHCSKWKTSVIFILGDGGSGKSNLALKLTYARNIIQTDALWFKDLGIRQDKNEIEKQLYELYTILFGNIEDVFKHVINNEKMKNYLAGILFKAIELYKGIQVVFVEGYGIRYILPLIEEKLKNENYKYWKLIGEDFNG